MLHRLSGLLAKEPSPVPLSPALILIVAACYGALVFCMGPVWLPPDSPVFAVFLLWASALVLAEFLSRTVRLPRVVGMVVSGMIWGNIPGTPTAAMPASWGALLRAAGLATAFLRCGLELDGALFRKFMLPTVTLLLIPGLVEAFYAAGLATVLFGGMPILLAISLGFILNAAGPGLVVPAMLWMQSKGYGSRAGVPFVPAMAASFDDFLAITGYSIFIHLAIQGQGHSSWDMAIGPVQIFIGAALGAAAGLTLGCTKIFSTWQYRIAGLISSSLFIMYLLNHFSMLSGGGLASLALAFVASFLWDRGLPKPLSSGPTTVHTAVASQAVSVFWSWVTEPLLFGTVMADVVFSTMPASIVGSALIIIFTGMVLRFVVAVATMWLCRYNWKQAMFLGVAWMPKATVQAALCGAPLVLVRQLKVHDADYSTWLRWGQAIQVTGSLTIVICGTLGTALTYKLGPLLLEQYSSDAPTLDRLADVEAPKGCTIEKAGQGDVGPAGAAALSATGLRGTVGSASAMLSSQTSHVFELQQYYAAVEELLGALRHSQEQQQVKVQEEKDPEAKAVAAAAGGGVVAEFAGELQQAQERVDRLHQRLNAGGVTVRQWLRLGAQQLSNSNTDN